MLLHIFHRTTERFSKKLGRPKYQILEHATVRFPNNAHFKVKPERDEEHKYIGLAEPSFKGRWADHCTSFRQRKQRNKSKLSTFVWDMNDKGQSCDIKWSVLRKSSPYRTGSDKCNLCLWEKLLIMKGNGDDKLINKRDELVSKCLHVNKFLLRKFKDREKWQFLWLLVDGEFSYLLVCILFLYFRFTTTIYLMILKDETLSYK